MHGLFNNKSVVNALMAYLYNVKGIDFGEYNISESGIQDELEKLCVQFEENIDTDEILKYFNK